MTIIRFASWARTAVGGAIDTADGTGTLPAAELTPGLSLIRPDGRATPLRGPSAMTMLGPEAVAGLDPRVVVRTDPPAGAGEFEDNYLACVDLRPIELPWMFTPARPGPSNRLRPWIVLVVVEVARSRLRPGSPVPTLAVGTDELPDLTDSWGWAHVQRSADPGQSVARLLCPRRLTGTTRYRACVVPAFTYSPTTRTYAPAWRIGQGHDAELQVYYSWEFGTGVSGDFEQLVGRLNPAPPDRITGLGTLLVDIRVPWAGDSPLQGAPTPAPLPVPGALVAIGPASAPEPPPAPLTAAVLSDFVSRLAPRCNAGSGLHDAADGVEVAVAPPVYGGRHVDRTRIPGDAAQVADWVDDLNVHIPTRIAAGLGAEYVRQNQETLMARAWEQVGEIREANRRRAEGQLAAAVDEALHRKHIRNLSLGEAISVAAPAATRTRPWSAGPPLATALTVSVAPNGIATSAFARFVRRRGSTGRAHGAVPASVVERSLVGDIGVPAVQFAPPFQAGTAPRIRTTARADTPPSVADAADLAERSVKAATDLIVLHALADTARANGLAATADMMTAELDLASVDTAAARAGRLTELRRSVTPHLESVTSAIATVGAQLQGRTAGPDGAAATAVGVRPDPRILRSQLVDALAPGDRVERRLAAQIHVPGPRSGAGELDPIMKYPTFPAPMVLGLLQSAPNWFLPGIAEFPADSVALLAPNGRFIESFLVGLSHEFNRELLWREFPTDLRGTSFRNFWPRTDGMADIPPIHTWTGPLGSHLAQGSAEISVLLVRGTVVRRFPNMLVAAAPAVSATPGQPPVVDTEPANWTPPRFVIPVDAQTMAYAFPLPPDALSAPPTPTAPGFFFAFQENSDRVRFGFDIANETFDTWYHLDWPRVLAAGPDDRPFARADADLKGPKDPAGMSWNVDATDIARITLQRPFRMLIHASELV